MAKEERARKAWGHVFDSVWMARINAETARIARSFRLPEDSVRAVAQNVAIALWRGSGAGSPRAPELPSSRAPEHYP